MTVSTEVDHNEYTGNGVTTTFPYTFRIFHKSDLVVQVVDLDENLSELILDTDYTVTGSGGYTGGNVILSSPLAGGYQISISRELPVTQETDLRNQGKFFAEVHEDAFDKLTMLIQQVRSWLNLALRKPSFVANYYDALNNYIRNLRDPVRKQDAATKNYVDILASTNLSKTLRTPENIPSLPNAISRANKLIAFDGGGNPIMVLPPSGSASDVLIELAKETGVSLVGGAVQVFENVEAMNEFNVQTGRVYTTKGYYTEGDGGDAYYLATTIGSTPDGYGDHVASNGVFLRLISQPTDLNHGVKVSGTYVPADARHNRNALQSMLRNPRWSETTCVVNGKYYILGSVNIGRSNIRWTINKGCFIVGRYDDPSIPTPDQAGGMFNFVDYFDPDNGDFAPFQPGDTRVNKYLSNIHVVLNGDISSEYNDIHSNKYNNNCISFAKVINCSVTGSGGISASDHRAINFDAFDTNVSGGSENRGGAINCHVDVAYINNTVDNPVNMLADIFTPSLCTVKIGSVGVMRTGGYDQPIVVNTANQADFRVDIGSYTGNSSISPRIVVARNCNSVHVKTGVIYNATTIVYSVDTLDVTLEPEEVYNTVTLINRADTMPGKLRSLRLRDLKSCNTSLLSAIYTTSNLSAFQLMEISNCSFSGAATSGFALHGNRLAPYIATSEDVRDNFLPAAGEVSGVFNRRSGGVSANLLTTDVTTFTFNPKSPAFLYSKASICIRNGVSRGIIEMDIQGRLVTTNDVTYTAGGQTLATSISNGSITVTTTSPAVLSFIVLHN